MASIRKRVLPSGNTTWLVDFKDANGRRRARQFATKRKADAFIVKARGEVARGTYVHDPESVTVATAAQAWLERCAERRDGRRRMEKATFRDYEGKTRLHILDPDLGIGGLKLSRLTRKVVSEFRDRLLSAGRSEAQTRKILSVLSLIVDQAQEDGMIGQNPVKGVRVLGKGRAKRPIVVPTRETVRLLVNTASDAFRPLLIVATLCGLRASETRGLRWSDVDFAGGSIHVRHRADAYNEFGDPKSAAGYRSVPMGPYAAAALRRWRLICPQSALDLVFPTTRGTVESHSNILKRKFKPLCRQLSIKMRWHDLRHFAVSLWIEQGFNVKEVMTFAGHSSVQMTMDRYGHLFPSPDHQGGMAEIEERLFGSPQHIRNIAG
jgi:integrase